MVVTEEDKIRYKTAEKKNYQQMTVNMKNEHEKLQKRLEVVGDPSYSLKLRKQIIGNFDLITPF